MVSRGKTEISALLPPSWKKCLGYPWKNPLLSPLEKNLPTQMSYTTMAQKLYLISTNKAWRRSWCLSRNRLRHKQILFRRKFFNTTNRSEN